MDKRERNFVAFSNVHAPDANRTQNACGADGLNTICFEQMDMAFTPGVLAFTRVITADVTGVHVGSSAVSRELGQILDADIYFSPALRSLERDDVPVRSGARNH